MAPFHSVFRHGPHTGARSVLFYELAQEGRRGLLEKKEEEEAAG